MLKEYFLRFFLEPKYSRLFSFIHSSLRIFFCIFLSLLSICLVYIASRFSLVSILFQSKILHIEISNSIDKVIYIFINGLYSKTPVCELTVILSVNNIV